MGQDQSTGRINCGIGQQDADDVKYESDRPNVHLEAFKNVQGQTYKESIIAQKRQPQQQQQRQYWDEDNSKVIAYPVKPVGGMLERSNIGAIMNQGEMQIYQHQNLLKVASYQFEGSAYNGQTKMYEERNSSLRNLTQLIENRVSIQTPFEEEDVLNLLESLVYGLAHLSKNRINHHNFYPTTIYRSNRSSDCPFKVVNPLSDLGSGYFLTQQRQRFSYLSPELILAVIGDLEEQKIEQEVLEKSDVFAIGLILLEFATLQPSADCYDGETYNILDVVIQSRFALIERIYGTGFGQRINNVIAQMLEYEISNRIGVEDLSLAVWKMVNQQRNSLKGKGTRVGGFPMSQMTQATIIPPPGATIIGAPVSQSPQMLQVPQLSQIHHIQSIQQIQAMQQAPQLAQIQQAPKPSQVQHFPQVQQLFQSSQLPQLPPGTMIVGPAVSELPPGATLIGGPVAHRSPQHSNPGYMQQSTQSHQLIMTQNGPVLANEQLQVSGGQGATRSRVLIGHPPLSQMEIQNRSASKDKMTQNYVYSEPQGMAAKLPPSQSYSPSLNMREESISRVPLKPFQEIDPKQSEDPQKFTYQKFNIDNYLLPSATASNPYPISSQYYEAKISGHDSYESKGSSYPLSPETGKLSGETQGPKYSYSSPYSFSESVAGKTATMEGVESEQNKVDRRKTEFLKFADSNQTNLAPYSSSLDKNDEKETLQQRVDRILNISKKIK